MTHVKTTCITGGRVWVGGDAPITAGGILITGSHIAAILSADEVAAACLTVDEVVDATGMLVMPPLVNTHVHSSSTLFRGTENSLPLELWSYYAINYGRGFVDEAIKYAVLLTSIEMIRGGVGAYVDHFPQSRFAETALQAHMDSGLRVAFAPFFADLADEDILGIPLDREALADVAPFVAPAAEDIHGRYARLYGAIRASGLSRVTLLAGPNSPQRCSDELWGLWARLQEQFSCGTHTHLLETLPQAAASFERWPQGLVPAMDAAGFLHGRLSIAHGVWLRDEDRALLAEHGVTLAFNPISNAMLGSGAKSIRKELDAGISVALGSDCSNTGGRHDLFEVMRQMLVSGRSPGTDYERWIKPEEALIAATAGGSRAFASDTFTAVLAAGAAADVLLFDLAGGSMAASRPSLESVVAHGDARNIRSLMVDGRWVLRNGVITVFDERAVLEQATAHAEELRERADAGRGILRSLHPSYSQWQRSFFDRHACDVCDPITPDLLRRWV